MSTFTFTTKETYLAYRAEWKAEYMTLSATIRSTKNLLKQQHRESGFGKMTEWSTLFKSVRRANVMLDELHKAKEEAGRQYNLAKETA